MITLNKRIILGSQSPRRKNLLEGAGIKFDVVVRSIDESYSDDLPPHKVAEYLANKKADAFNSDIKDDELVITADSIVVHENVIYEKPKDYNDGVRILSMLSESTHTVFTGVCIRSIDKRISFTESTAVTLDKLSIEEINYYLNKHKPYDKAGAYGIQDWIGLCKVKKIEGSYPNVIGLPVHQLYQKLQLFK